MERLKCETQPVISVFRKDNVRYEATTSVENLLYVQASSIHDRFEGWYEIQGRETEYSEARVPTEILL